MRFCLFSRRAVHAFVFAVLLATGFISSSSLGADNQAPPSPALWKVEGSHNTVWLFGTFHLLPAGLEWRTDDMTSAFGQADILVLEAPVERGNEQNLAALIRSRGLLGPEESLSNLLSNKDFTQLQSMAGSLGLPLQALNRMRPWFASLTLTQSYISTLGYLPDAGADRQLAASARLTGKQVAFLETIEQQIGFFADYPDDVQVKNLQFTLQQIEETPDMIDSLLQSWLSGDTAKLDALFNDRLKDIPEVYDRLVRQRNSVWTTLIERMLSQPQNYFIAVGTGHLVGKDSVVAQLRALGRPISPQ